MSYSNPRTMSSKRKSSGGGIMSLIGGLTGASGLTGGGFDKGFDADAAALDEFKKSGVDTSDEDASFDAYNTVRQNQIANGITSKAPGFIQYKVQHPLLDAIFGRGQGAAQANQMNFQQGLTEAGMYNNSDIARRDNEASFIRQNMGDEAAAERQLMANKSAMNLARFGHDSGIASKAGVMTQGFEDLQNTINQPNINTAGNIAQIRSKNSSTPRFSQLVTQNQEAEQMALPVDVMQKSMIDVGQNSSAFQPSFNGYQSSMRYDGPQMNQDVVMTGGFPMKDEKGNTIMVGQKPEVVTRRSPASMTNLDEQKSKEDAIRAKLQAAKTGQPNVGGVTPTIQSKRQSSNSNFVNPVNSIPEGTKQAVIDFIRKIFVQDNPQVLY